jgi:hypothetical protein
MARTALWVRDVRQQFRGSGSPEGVRQIRTQFRRRGVKRRSRLGGCSRFSSRERLSCVLVAGEPVSRILCVAQPASRFASERLSRASRRSFLWVPDRSGTQAAYPRVRASRSCERSAYGPGQPSPPIWPCSTRGFPCPGCCHPGGGLLPHLFTLAKCARPKQASPWFFLRPAAEVQASPAVYSLWHFP